MITQDTAPTGDSIELPDSSSYRERLKYWAIVRVFPDRKQLVARFRSRSDADGHLQVLNRSTPNAKFVIVFDCHHQLN